jgi:hypothetical protein
MLLTYGSVTKRCRSWLVCTCILGVAALSGCSGGGGGRTFPTGEVSGTVKYNGEPIPQGKITFIGTETGDFAWAPINNGSYTVKAPLGMCKIEIQIQSDENKFAIPPQQMGMAKAKMKELRDKGMNVPDLPGEAKKTTINLPEKYTSAASSGLTFEVQAGTQNKEWDLQ